MKAKPRLCVLFKTGANHSRMFPTTSKEIEWEHKPEEIYVDLRDQPVESLLKSYPEYEVKYLAKKEA